VKSKRLSNSTLRRINDIVNRCGRYSQKAVVRKNERAQALASEVRKGAHEQ